MNKQSWGSLLICMILLAMPRLAVSQSDWRTDYKFQELKNRPALEVRYVDTNRDAFEIIAADYQLTGDLLPPNLLYESNTSKPWLYFEVTGPDGKIYSTQYSQTKSRINLYRRGPYYCEIHWVDLTFADKGGVALPLKAEVVLYCYPEKAKGSLKLFSSGNVEAMTFLVRGKTETKLVAGKLEKDQTQFFNFELFGETKPLPDKAFTRIKGVTPVSYDARKGQYTIGSETVNGFQRQYFDNPNGYEEVTFSVKNDATPRKIYICQQTLVGEGIVEGGAVLDAKGHPLPILVQVSKNFAGEKEERFYNPRDTAFSETFFPLYLEPYEELEISSLHLYQNWGRHMTKHWSSLGFFMDYFHSSTGVTETTCYIPFKFGHKTGIAIGDFRAMSQETFWSGQPQHDNVAGHNFLTYYDGKKWNYSEYRGTTYRSTGNNWCNVEMEYLTSDSCIQLLLDIWEVPQDDELRSFFTARYKVLRPLTVEDARANFRFLDISSTQQNLRYKNYAFTDAAGKVVSKPIDFNQSPFCVKGEELPVKNSFAAIFGEAKGSNGIMIRSFESNSGVKPAFSIQQKAHIPEPKDTTVNEHKAYTPEMKEGDVRFSLVPSTDKLVLQPGDEMTLSGFWLPYGEVDGAKSPVKEILAFGQDEPKVVAVKKGLVLGNLPTTIRVENDEAQFVLKGGLNVIPIIAKGFKTSRYPALYEKIGERWEFVPQHHNSTMDGMQTFCDNEGKFGTVFLVRTNGEPREFRIRAGKPYQESPRIVLQPKPSNKAVVAISNPFEKLPLALKIDNQQFSGNLLWEESIGKSFWYNSVAKDTLSGARITGFEDRVAIQYWWQNGQKETMVRSPRFELETGANLFTGNYKAYIYKNGKLIECGKMKKETTFEIGQTVKEEKPAIVVLYHPELNYCLAFAFKNGASVFIKKSSFGVNLLPQNCPEGRRKVMEGNVYLRKGGADELIRQIEHELPVWKPMS
jgi:hypothetical protein